ncbi:hypothetical protein CUR178_04201 [Leishmania enriettii]|uniref:Uncharacterized protein n=1 Tax=Leishmania enriettii TaxID=5663 RepID=A0A836GY67_LEIEN|nr:hypothetical protein CUR178_04201 [Leishmania enriettii]
MRVEASRSSSLVCSYQAECDVVELGHELLPVHPDHSRNSVGRVIGVAGFLSILQAPSRTLFANQAHSRERCSQIPWRTVVRPPPQAHGSGPPVAAHAGKASQPRPRGNAVVPRQVPRAEDASAAKHSRHGVPHPSEATEGERRHRHTARLSLRRARPGG